MDKSNIRCYLNFLTFNFETCENNKMTLENMTNRNAKCIKRFKIFKNISLIFVEEKNQF